MAEFQEVMKQYNMMFEAHKKGAMIPVEASYKTAVKQPDFFEKVVMEWAAEHPVVYPYIIDVLQDVFNMSKGLSPMNIWEWLNTIRIPEELAKKLGIEPKEG